ncbi:hypothetical protein DYU05_00040 [Mucilaginibacter terrenus]|uniref:Uncharacterized protein n=1 Tax=Mucilaginibacter terrenus TaxID=2482727 RepID=A0A3E2NSY8_9SPHI|nr:hypothetical protein [Mucilaginibacter terrenus]RFZ84067.1 hypothetical protein DYU05_00040 [Mucilaginibacter terrenus]
MKTTFLKILTLLCFFLGVLTSCERYIKLEVSHETSELLNCDKVFAGTRKSIVELNEFLIQTGTIDTIEDRSAYAAIIRINGKEVILDLKRIKQSIDGSTAETFTGHNYTLELYYQKRRIHSAEFFEGFAIVKCGKIATRYEVAGINNIL